LVGLKMIEKKTLFYIAIFLFLFKTAFAADYYVSPTGSASWGNATSIDTPCSLSTAFTNASAGDTVYLRGGSYTGVSSYGTNNAGTGGAENQRIIFKAYQDETPSISGLEARACISVDHAYWTFDGLTISGYQNYPGGTGGVISTYDTGNVDGLEVKNCHIILNNAVSVDNVVAIYIEGMDGGVIENNEIEGFRTDGNGGIILNMSTGIRILNNEIHTFAVGIHQKWPNCDSSYDSNAEWAGNYIYNVGTGLEFRISYVNVHDNIINSSNQVIKAGIMSGGGCTPVVGSLINHNTFYGQNMYSSNEAESLGGYILKNNIFTPSNIEIYGTNGTWTYNIYPNTSAQGTTGEQGNTPVTFVGGANPSTIAGFALAQGSNGEDDGDDGEDMGADVTLVGLNTPSQSGVTMSGVTIGQ
jgi:hypothetical protein